MNSIRAVCKTKRHILGIAILAAALGGMLMFFSGCRSARGISELERKAKALWLHIMTFSNPEPPLDKWPCDFVASVDMEQHNASEYFKWAYEDQFEPETHLYLNLLVERETPKTSKLDILSGSNLMWCVVAGTNNEAQFRSDTALFFTANMFELAGIESLFKSNSTSRRYVPMDAKGAVAVTVGGRIITIRSQERERCRQFLDSLVTNRDVRILYP